MELSFKKKENKVNYPTKTTINFISNQQQKNDRAAIIGFVVFMLFLGIFVKFAVIDPLNKVNQAEAVYRSMESQLNSYKTALADYEDVENRYNELVGSFMSESEASYLDRIDIIKMVEEDVMKYVEVRSIAISGNTVRVSTDTSTMDNISNIVNILLNDSRNSYVTVTTAQANKDVKDMVYANLVIVYSGVKQ